MSSLVFALLIIAIVVLVLRRSAASGFRSPRLGRSSPSLMFVVVIIGVVVSASHLGALSL
jgi:hypothetical protein